MHSGIFLRNFMHILAKEFAKELAGIWKDLYVQVQA